MELSSLKICKNVSLVLSIFSFLTIAYFLLTIVNVGISLKYEVDQTKTVSEIKGIDNIDSIKKLEEKLLHQKQVAERNAKISAIIFLVFFTAYISINYFYNKKKSEINYEKKMD